MSTELSDERIFEIDKEVGIHDWHNYDERTLDFARAIESEVRALTSATAAQAPSDELSQGLAWSNDPEWKAQLLAEHFHATYERLAPSFGYETRPDTKAFQPASANGRLMIAVCRDLVDRIGFALSHPNTLACDKAAAQAPEPVAWLWPLPEREPGVLPHVVVSPEAGRGLSGAFPVYASPPKGAGAGAGADSVHQVGE